MMDSKPLTAQKMSISMENHIILSVLKTNGRPKCILKIECPQAWQLKFSPKHTDPTPNLSKLTVSTSLPDLSPDQLCLTTLELRITS